MNEIGQGEQIDPSWGVYNVAVRDYLNDWLQTQGQITLDYYVENTDTTKAQLKNFIITDIDYSVAMESALWTGDETLPTPVMMPGWPTTINVKHIAAIRGYVMSTNHFTVHYVESGQAAQGYTGSNNFFYQQLSLTNFYKHVNAYDGIAGKDNNSQVW